MKTQLILTSLALASALNGEHISLLDSPPPISFGRHYPMPTTRHEIVMLYSFQSGTSTNNVFQYNGVQVYCSSSSDGAPHFPQAFVGQQEGLVETAEAIAKLRTEGYNTIKISDNGQMIIMEK